MIDIDNSWYLYQFVYDILMLASKVDFSITSWGRTEKHNRDVGGVPGSKHLKFKAVDVGFDNMEDKTKFIDLAHTMNMKVFIESDHVHVESSD